MEPPATASAPAIAAGAALPQGAAAGTGATGGERPSLRSVFETEESGLLRYALGLTGRRAVAEETVQEAFLRLHGLWAEVENPRAWLYRCVRNLALNHRRDHRPETELPDEAPAPEAALPVETLARDEAVGAMRLLLAELPPEDRTLVQLKYQDDLKYQEIGRRTGLSAGNVGYRLHHVLKALADGLRRAGIESSRG